MPLSSFAWSPRPAARSTVALALVVVATLACGSRDRAPDTAASAPTPPARSEPALADVTREQFAQLRWIEGSWRGTGGEGQAPFYERYDVVDDTTILMQSFADSTLRRATSESRIVLTGGRVLNTEGTGAHVSGASRIDATSIHFVPVRDGYTFSWRRGATVDEWIATVGASGDRTYTMRRWRAP